MRNSEAKSSGSSHSADDLSPDVIWCRKWPEDAKRIVPANSESKNWNLCRQCWRDKGSPFFNACCYKCSEEGCPNVSYKTRGAAYHLRICQSCYKKKAKVSGSSHSADDRSANLLLCENCPEDAKRVVPANTESKNWNLGGFGLSTSGE